MTLVAKEFRFGTVEATGSYTASKVFLGALMTQVSQSGGPENVWAGPYPIALARPVEQALAIPGIFPVVVEENDTTDLVFIADFAAAAATRRIQAYRYSHVSNAYNWEGAITLTLNTTTNHTIRGMDAFKYTWTGSILSGVGTSVTASAFDFSARRVTTGSRIGFGSTNPNEISTWYETKAFPSGGTMLLSSSLPAPIANTPFIVEDYWIALTTTNATAGAGGLYIVKGLVPQVFQNPATVIGSASLVTGDTTRRVHRLMDAATNRHTASAGLNFSSSWSDTTHSMFCLNGGGTVAGQIIKHNIRAPLNMPANLNGSDTASTVQVVTGMQSITPALIEQNNNLLYWTLGHGPGSGSPSLYYTARSQVRRADESALTTGNTTWNSDFMSEVPPGGTSTFNATAALTSIDVMDTIDRLVLLSTHVSGARSFVTQYNTIANPFDHIFLTNTQQLDQTSADTGVTPHPSTNVSPMTLWTNKGVSHIIRHSLLASANHMYAVPLEAERQYASTTGAYLLTPKILTPNCAQYSRVAVFEDRRVGGVNLGISTESWRMYYRTSGIDDNSGGWTAVQEAGNMHGIAGSPEIQFKFEFRTLGHACVPARILSVIITYESSDVLPSQFEWNLNDSNTSDGTVGFNQVSLFGGSVPTLTINYYRSDTDALVLSQGSNTSTNGEFQYWNGSAWTSGVGTDVVNTRRRFVPSAGLPAGVNVYVKISSE